MRKPLKSFEKRSCVFKRLFWLPYRIQMDEDKDGAKEMNPESTVVIQARKDAAWFKVLTSG